MTDSEKLDFVVAWIQKQERKEAQPRANFLPDHFTPSDSVVAWARGRQYSDEDIRFAFAKMKAWAQGGGHKRVDWNAVLRTFLLGMRERGELTTPQPKRLVV